RCCSGLREPGFVLRAVEAPPLEASKFAASVVVRLAGNPENMDIIQVALNDSMVVVGAMCKGRFGLGPGRTPIGWEIFVEQTGVTNAYLQQGWEMLTPAEGASQLGVFDPEVDRMIAEGAVDWVWFSPPEAAFVGRCGTGGDHDHLRPDPKIEYHYACWARTLGLAEKLIHCGGHFVIQHPRCSKAWRLRSTELFLRNEGVKRYRWDACAYVSDAPRAHVSAGGPQYSNLLLSNAPWLGSAVKQCPRDHTHAPTRPGQHIRSRPYPVEFCRQLVASHAAREGRASSTEPGGSVF
ncbi:Catsper1, partial [Symbiodinium necroappetens]